MEEQKEDLNENPIKVYNDYMGEKFENMTIRQMIVICIAFILLVVLISFYAGWNIGYAAKECSWLLPEVLF